MKLGPEKSRIYLNTILVKKIQTWLLRDALEDAIFGGEMKTKMVT